MIGATHIYRMRDEYEGTYMSRDTLPHPRNDLPHLAARVFNTPLLVHAQKLDTILSVVGPRITTGAPVASLVDTDEEPASLVAYHGGLGVFVLPIVGTLVRRGSWLDAASGLKSYAQIGEAVERTLARPDCRGLMLELDSPGGEAGGCFDLVERILAASASTGKPVWSHANELAASAGYAIASAGEALWLARTAEVGSIGVVAAHVDTSGADAAEGVRWTYVYAGERKVDGNPHEPLSDRARAAIQEDVDSLYGLFVDLVAENRGLSAAKVRATQAGIYRGEMAVRAGLGDKVGTLEDAILAMAEHIDERRAA